MELTVAGSNPVDHPRNPFYHYYMAIKKLKKNHYLTVVIKIILIASLIAGGVVLASRPLEKLGQLRKNKKEVLGGSAVNKIIDDGR